MKAIVMSRNSVKTSEKNFIKVSFMTRENMNSIEIIVETEKLFVINEENTLFFMINFEDD